MEIEKPSRRRRTHPEEFKQAVIAACCEPGASVAGIALANGINANQVRRWMRERDTSAEPQPASTIDFTGAHCRTGLCTDSSHRFKPP